VVFEEEKKLTKVSAMAVPYPDTYGALSLKKPRAAATVSAEIEDLIVVEEEEAKQMQQDFSVESLKQNLNIMDDAKFFREDSRNIADQSLNRTNDRQHFTQSGIQPPHRVEDETK
jgi:hypothetical protein